MSIYMYDIQLCIALWLGTHLCDIGLWTDYRFDGAGQRVGSGEGEISEIRKDNHNTVRFQGDKPGWCWFSDQSLKLIGKQVQAQPLE